MASARIYETTRDRLAALFKRKEFKDENQAYNYFFNMHPRETDIIDYDIINGIIRFLRDAKIRNISCKSFDSDQIFSYTEISSSESCISDGISISITFKNYNTQYPMIYINPGVFEGYNNTPIPFIELKNPIERKYTIVTTMRVLASLLAQMYKYLLSNKLE